MLLLRIEGIIVALGAPKILIKLLWQQFKKETTIMWHKQAAGKKLRRTILVHYGHSLYQACLYVATRRTLNKQESGA